METKHDPGTPRTMGPEDVKKIVGLSIPNLKCTGFAYVIRAAEKGPGDGNENANSRN